MTNAQIFCLSLQHKETSLEMHYMGGFVWEWKNFAPLRQDKKNCPHGGQRPEDLQSWKTHGFAIRSKNKILCTRRWAICGEWLKSTSQPRDHHEESWKRYVIGDLSPSDTRNIPAFIQSISELSQRRIGLLYMSSARGNWKTMTCICRKAEITVL